MTQVLTKTPDPRAKKLSEISPISETSRTHPCFIHLTQQCFICEVNEMLQADAPIKFYKSHLENGPLITWRYAQFVDVQDID